MTTTVVDLTQSVPSTGFRTPTLDEIFFFSLFRRIEHALEFDNQLSESLKSLTDQRAVKKPAIEVFSLMIHLEVQLERIAFG